MSRPNVHGLPHHLRKDGQGYFLDYFVREEGIRKRKRVRIGQVHLAQAKQVLAEHLKAIVQGRFLEQERPKTTFAEAADAFLAYSKARKKSHRNDEQIVARLRIYFGDRPLESLTPDLVEGFLVKRKREKELTGATLNRDMACLKTIVRRALLNRQIERNPVEGLRRFKEESRDRTLSPGEYRALLKQCSPHLRSIVQAAYTTGMRRGEVLGLKWSQVDLRNKVSALAAEDTKTGEKREVPLTDSLVAMFRQVPKTLGSPHVFTFKGKPVGSVKTAFRAACRRAGVGDFRFHDLRHCTVTNLRKAGVGDTVIMSISSHKTHAMFKRYDRIDRKNRQEAVRRAESLIDTDMTLVDNHPLQRVGQVAGNVVAQ